MLFSLCTHVVSKLFTVIHVLSWMKDGFVSNRHNIIRLYGSDEKHNEALFLITNEFL